MFKKPEELPLVPLDKALKFLVRIHLKRSHYKWTAMRWTDVLWTFAFQLHAVLESGIKIWLNQRVTRFRELLERGMTSDKTALTCRTVFAGQTCRLWGFAPLLLAGISPHLSWHDAVGMAPELCGGSDNHYPCLYHDYPQNPPRTQTLWEAKSKTGILNFLMPRTPKYDDPLTKI